MEEPRRLRETRIQELDGVGKGGELTEWTVVPRDFTFRASSFKWQSTNPTDIVILIIVVPVVIVRRRPGLGIMVQFVLFRRGVPFPSGHCVVGDYGEFHRGGYGRAGMIRSDRGGFGLSGVSAFDVSLQAACSDMRSLW